MNGLSLKPNKHHLTVQLKVHQNGLNSETIPCDVDVLLIRLNKE
jgi:hypothetical protein